MANITKLVGTAGSTNEASHHIKYDEQWLKKINGVYAKKSPNQNYHRNLITEFFSSQLDGMNLDNMPFQQDGAPSASTTPHMKQSIYCRNDFQIKSLRKFHLISDK